MFKFKDTVKCKHLNKNNLWTFNKILEYLNTQQNKVS